MRRAQAVDVEHPLHRGQGGVECGDIGLTVGIHGSSGYRCQIGSVITVSTAAQSAQRVQRLAPVTVLADC